MCAFCNVHQECQHPTGSLLQNGHALDPCTYFARYRLLAVVGPGVRTNQKPGLNKTNMLEPVTLRICKEAHIKYGFEASTEHCALNVLATWKQLPLLGIA
jgi:hypothetical protein